MNHMWYRVRGVYILLMKSQQLPKSVLRTDLIHVYHSNLCILYIDRRYLIILQLRLFKHIFRDLRRAVLIDFLCCTLQSINLTVVSPHYVPDSVTYFHVDFFFIYI